MDKSEIFANFINQYRQPFDINVVMQVIGCGRASAKVFMKEAARQGKIMCIQRGCTPIFVSINCYHVNKSTNTRSRWNTKPEVEVKIRQLLVKNHYSSGRTLAKDIGKSHEFVYKYLQEMRENREIIGI